jgi:PGAP1-like protein
VTAPPGPAPVSVRGGSDGVDARFEDMNELSALFARAAADAAQTALATHGHLLNVAALGGAALDPGGAVRFEQELALALDGPHGLVALAASCGCLAAGIRAAAAAYRAADELDTDVHLLADPLLEFPRAGWRGLSTTFTTGSIVAGLNAFATADPGLGDLAAGVGLTAVQIDSPLLYQRLAEDGHPVVHDLGDVDAPTGAAPRSVADLVGGLATRDAGKPGEVDVRFVYRADGTRSVIVDIPGTKSWTPWRTPDVTSLSTNLRALHGEATSYGQGVLQAMARAGVRPDDPVMLVGHSEGGMVAVRAAIDAHRSKQFDITHVVTAGSPIGQFAADVPDAVQVLAIENKHDVVPHLDAATNPPAPNVTTVTVDHDSHGVLDNHDLTLSYVPGARDIDGSGNASIRDYLAGAQGFLDGTGVRTHRFAVSRAY